MKKQIAALFAATFLLIAAITPAFANPYSLRAENGLILPPAGLGIDFSGAVSLNNSDRLDSYQARIGYGVSPAVTIAGNLEKESGERRLVAEVLFSPLFEGGGYTVYCGYDLTDSRLAGYGLSMWADLHRLLAFVNFESDYDRNQVRSGSVTPGFNLKLTSRLLLAGEAEIGVTDWETREIRAGVGYKLNQKTTAKFSVSEARGGDSPKVYNAGLTMEI